MLNRVEYPLFSGIKRIGVFDTNLEKTEFCVKLINDLTFYEVPIEFWKGYCKGEREFNHNIVYEWMCDRVTPSGRQNIEDFLKDAGLENYDVVGLFFHAKGKSCRDDIAIIEPFLNKG